MNVIITGSNRGIGKAMVEAFAASGANIWACARKSTPEHEAWLKETADKANVWIKPVYFELTYKDAINSGIQSIIDDGQPIDVLVNNAGISTVGLLSMSKVEDIENLFAVNYFAMLRIIQKVSKRMARQKKGVIINMGSIAGIEPQAGKIAYGSSKAAVMMMTQCLAKELGPSGITVNCVAPGVIDTEMNRLLSPADKAALAEETPLMRLGTAMDAAKAIWFLISDAGDYFTGQVLSPNGGFVI